MDEISISKRLIEEARSMLNLNPDSQTDWKILIVDNVGKDILKPLTSEDLKNHYVTLRLFIDDERDPITDPVSAVYFVMPSDENIELICKDLKNHLYDSYYFNFISPLPYKKLKIIADAASLAQAAINVRRVYNSYLNFIALEDDFFVLRESEKHSISFHALNQSDASDEDISLVIDNIVEGLLSVLVSLNIIPYIRSMKGGPSEVVAKKLTQKISESLNDSKKILFNGSAQRPLLCLVDRTLDMNIPLHHTWTYQALIHDLLNTELNRVKITETTEKSGTKTKLFELNSNDKFWIQHKGSPFPQVAEAVQRELEECKKREEELNINEPTDRVEIFTESSSRISKNARPLTHELNERKQVLALHTTIATSVLYEIKARKLDNFFEIEEKIMNRSTIDRVILDDMLANPDYGLPSDKYRLFLISYICDNPNLTEDEAEKYINILESLGCERSAFDYVKQWKTFLKTNLASLQSSLQSSSGLLKTAGMFTKLMSKGSQFVMEGVKNLVLKEHHLPLTKILDGLMGHSSRKSREFMEYTYFDPKRPNVADTERKKAFDSAIVFVVGGGNYIEYQNLVDYSKSISKSALGPPAGKHVIYGSTDLMNANQFLDQLGQLGDSIS